MTEMNEGDECSVNSSKAWNKSDDANDPRQCSVAIIGAGLTGLATALMLGNECGNIPTNGTRRIAVFDRDASHLARKEGYGLTLTYNPEGILRKLGVLDEIAGADCPSRSHYLIRQQPNRNEGEVIGYFGNALHAVCGSDDEKTKNSYGWGQRGNLRVPRQTVRQILLRRLQDIAPNVTIHWNHNLVNVTNDSQNLLLKLHFENGVIFKNVALVIGADGINSSVVRCCLPQIPSPVSLGIQVILGITGNNENGPKPSVFRPDLDYPDLFKEGGFYTLAEQKRLFVMPYSTCVNGQQCPRYMWQLSFASNVLSANCVNCVFRNYTDKACHLQEIALRLTEGWHEPVQAMIKSTPITTIWGTEIKDREPLAIQQALLDSNQHRIIVAGDALHAMSPFKGQGANNCLRDAQTILKWFGNEVMTKKKIKSSFTASSKGCMRELVQRTAPVVVASRSAAKYWHSSQALDASQHKFAGLNPIHSQLVLDIMKCRGVHAAQPNLTKVIQNIIREQKILNTIGDCTSLTKNLAQIHYSRKKRQKEHLENLKEVINAAMDASSTGKLGELRRISWYHPNLLRDHCFSLTEQACKTNLEPMLLGTVGTTNSTNCTASTCLHAAVVAGHVDIVQWLITEAGCPARIIDVSHASQDQTRICPKILQILEFHKNDVTSQC
jgi:salicylate hydroxylase